MLLGEDWEDAGGLELFFLGADWVGGRVGGWVGGCFLSLSSL